MPYRVPPFADCVQCAQPAIPGQLYCLRHGGSADLEPWYACIERVQTDDELQAVCTVMELHGIVLDDWPGLSKEVRAKRNRLKLEAAKARRAA